jgi:uncharacterized protein YcbX
MMKVAELWRYPVKSTQGEHRQTLRLSERGVDGDRRYGVLDRTTGTVVTAKKDGRLLEARAMLAGVELTLRLPNGETALGVGPGVDAALSAWLGRPVGLIEARPGGRAVYEAPIDVEDDDSELVRWEGPQGAFVDTEPVHLLTTGTLRAMARQRPDLRWDVRRFRPNLVIDAGADDCVEDGWIGRRLIIGGVELEVSRPCARCVMTTRAQPGGIDRQVEVFRHINTTRRAMLGVYARVVVGGEIQVGQAVTVSP